MYSLWQKSHLLGHIISENELNAILSWYNLSFSIISYPSTGSIVDLLLYCKFHIPPCLSFSGQEITLHWFHVHFFIPQVYIIPSPPVCVNFTRLMSCVIYNLSIKDHLDAARPSSCSNRIRFKGYETMSVKSFYLLTCMG